MNNRFSGFAGQILSNSRNIPKMIKEDLQTSEICNLKDIVSSKTTPRLETAFTGTTSTSPTRRHDNDGQKQCLDPRSDCQNDLL